jgi:alpha-acetolactate decarboxylase
MEIRGWHLHFATADRAAGGHVLDCELQRGTAQLDHTTRLRVELPPTVHAPGGTSIEQGELLDRLEHDG